MTGAASVGATDIEGLRCVVVGAGSVGRRHLRNLAAVGVESVALRSMSGQAGELEGWTTMHDWEAVARFRPHMAIIANPTAHHVNSALEATRLGCHLLVEKPVADRLDSALHLRDAVALRRTTALVGYQFRYHPTLRIVRDWVRDGVIGDPLAAHAHWGEYLPAWHPDEDHLAGYSARRDLGGGVVLTLSHPIDYLRWILGEVSAVAAMTTRGTGLTRDVEDVASLSMRMTSGALATITLDYVERPTRHSLSVTGTRGTIFWDAISGAAHTSDDSGVQRGLVTPAAGYERNAMFVEELRHFLACIGGTEVPLCSLHDGVRAVAIAEGALRSAREGRVIDV